MALSHAHTSAPELRLQIVRPLVTLALCLLALTALATYAPSFFKLNNFINILVQASTLAVLAIGMAVVMIGGGIDLSLPFNAALSAVFGAMYMRAYGDPIGGPLVMIGSALAIGVL